jgi:hypothetical protein
MLYSQTIKSRIVCEYINTLLCVYTVDRFKENIVLLTISDVWYFTVTGHEKHKTIAYMGEIATQ